jgi:hypothetical protein
MEDRLPARLADVDADVVAVRRVSMFDGHPGVGDSREQFSPFSVRCIEPGGDVPDRNQQCVARAHGEAVPQPIDKGTSKEDALGFRRAEGTAGRAQDD